MKLLVLTALIFTSSAFGALNMKPGLWKVDMTISSQGKEMNPQAEMKKAMAKMSPEQKKQMAAMMSKIGNGGIDPDGMKVCFSQESLKNPENLSKQDNNRNCKTHIVSQTETKVVSTLTCEDGTIGNSVFNMSGNKYNGVIDMTSPKHGKSTTSLKGKYLGGDCGKLKPI